MENVFGLSYLDALSKSLEIVKRDGLHLFDKNGDFTAKTQIMFMSSTYQNIDPDAFIQALMSIEGDEKVFKKDIESVIKTCFIKNGAMPMHPMDLERLKVLARKYKLEIKRFAAETEFFLTPVNILFPDVEYKLKREHPQWCSPFKSEIKAYTNFKKEYIVDGILGLLPAGKSYGGFVKAYFHVKMCQSDSKSNDFQHMLGMYRVLYNSKNFKIDERLEWFEKLDIKAEDCALWSRIFDKKFPGYKDLHKFFGQIA